MLAGENNDTPVFGFGGSQGEIVQNDLKYDELMVSGGITGHVFLTGESILVNDTLLDKRYKVVLGWDAGSEMCVPLKDGDRVLGFIDVESSLRNAFSNNDLLAIESLAGVLATVVTVPLVIPGTGANLVPSTRLSSWAAPSGPSNPA